jgi:hypothetical protein
MDYADAFEELGNAFEDGEDVMASFEKHTKQFESLLNTLLTVGLEEWREGFKMNGVNKTEFARTGVSQGELDATIRLGEQFAGLIKRDWRDNLAKTRTRLLAIGRKRK